MIEDIGYFLLIVYALATWRVASLLVNEAGPYAVFIRLRILCGAQYWSSLSEDDDIEYISSNLNDWLDNEDTFDIVYTNEFAKLFSCVWCMSMWISLFFVACQLLLPIQLLNLIHIFSLWMAISALSIKISEI